MSHQAVLARRTVKGWKGAHVQWALPGWTLPELHRLLEDELRRGAKSAGEALQTVWEREVAPHTRFDRWPDRGSATTGWGRVSSNRNPQPLTYAYVFVLDPEAEEVEVLRSRACKTHQAQLDAEPAARRTGWVEAGGDPDWTCPSGVQNTTYQRKGAGRSGEYAEHRTHKVRGCTCHCTGNWARKHESVLKYPARLHTLAYAIEDIANSGGGGHERAEALAGRALEGGAETAEVWATLVLDGSSPEEALQAALSLGARVRTPPARAQ